MSNVLDLEVYAFELLNKLHDEYGVMDTNGDFATRIQNANTEVELEALIKALQSIILQIMKYRLVQK